MPVSQTVERENLKSLRLCFVEKSDQVSAVLSDLKRLAKRPVASTLSVMPAIRELAGVELDLEDLGMTGHYVWQFLNECINSFDKRVWCYVRELEPNEFREAIHIAFGSHPTRSLWDDIWASSEYRCEAMAAFLKMPYVYGTWRKYRWVLFNELALHIVEYATSKKGGSTNSKPPKQL